MNLIETEISGDNVSRLPTPSFTRDDLRALRCPEDRLDLVYALNTPEIIQSYIDTFSYNHENTSAGFVDITRTRKAHCFEGACFAYPLLWLHGYNPKIVVIQADNTLSEDHNILMYTDQKKIGAVGMSNWDTLKSRTPMYDSVDQLMKSYEPYYLSDYPGHVGEPCMIGYSEPIDFVTKYGTGWFFREGETALEYLFMTYSVDSWCINIRTHEQYRYPPGD